MHRFNFPRLAAVLLTAIVIFAACVQGPGTAGPRGPSDTAPAFAVTVADQTYTEGEAVSPLPLPAASGGNGTLSYSLAPTVPGLTFAAATRTLSGTPTSAGTYAMTYQAVDGDNNTAASDAATLSFTITVQEPEPPDTAPAFAVTVADQTYTEGEAVSPLPLPAASGGNGTLSYSLAPTVPGLTFIAATRTLSGAPTTAGTYAMTYQAVDGDNNTAASDAATLSFTITVQEPEPPDTAPAFAVTVADQTYTEGEAVSPLPLPAASGGNGTLSYSLAPTVPGLTFAAATRTLSGTPTSAGSYAMTYQAVDGDNNTAASDAATLSFTITVQEPEPPDTAPAFAVTVADQTYTEGEAVSPLTLPEASGGNGTLSYSLTPTVPGLTFAAATRTLSGTPTSAGSYAMTYQAVDGDANTTASDAAMLTFTITVQPAPTPAPVGCSADAETWRGLRVCDERPQDGYDRDDYGTGYRSLEDDIIAALPSTMKANGQVYTPYSCIAFDITPSGTAATDIEHIVALAEAHDSGIADDRRRDFAADLDNLTIADPPVNRSKGARDAAEWMPTRHGAWFAERVIQVRQEYGLTIDPDERDALKALLAGGGAQLNCVN